MKEEKYIENNWVNVKDLLPDFGIKVLVHGIPKNPVMEGTIISISMRQDIKGTSFENDRRLQENMKDNNGFNPGILVLHWMPLPKKPVNI